MSGINPSERRRVVIEEAKILVAKQHSLEDQLEVLGNRIQQMVEERNRNSAEASRFQPVIDEVLLQIRTVSGNRLNRLSKELQLAKLNGKLEALAPFYEPPMNIARDLTAQLKPEHEAFEGLMNELMLVLEEKTRVLAILNGFSGILVDNVDDVIFLIKHCDPGFTFPVPSTNEFLGNLAAALAENQVRVSHVTSEVPA